MVVQRIVSLKIKNIVKVCLPMVLLVILWGFQNFSQVTPTDIIGGNDLELPIMDHDKVGNPLNRSYIVHLPTGYTGPFPLPVVLVFHGGNGSGQAVAVQSQMNLVADNNKFIVIYPNGERKPDLRFQDSADLKRALFLKFLLAGLPVSVSSGKAAEVDQYGLFRLWGSGGDREEERNSDIDDVQFIKRILDESPIKFAFDQNRIFATGISNGAQMVHRLGCELSDRIAAIAPVSSGIVIPKTTCNPQRGVPVYQLHGVLDPAWPFKGGAGCFTKDIFEDPKKTFSMWRSKNLCTKITKTHKGPIRCDIATGCKGNVSVSFCKIKDGGHTWPGGKKFITEYFKGEDTSPWDNTCGLTSVSGMDHQGNGPISSSMNASQEIWNFFKQYSLP